MTESRYGRANIDIFCDLVRTIGKDPTISEILHNKTLYFIPQDDPELALANLERARRQNFPSEQIVFLGATKSEGSQTYNTFAIKEPPVTI